MGNEINTNNAVLLNGLPQKAIDTLRWLRSRDVSGETNGDYYCDQINSVMRLIIDAMLPLSDEAIKKEHIEALFSLNMIYDIIKRLSL